MNLAEAVHILGTLHDETQAGQGCMYIPVEVAEAILGGWEDGQLEYAAVLPGFGMGDPKVLRTEDQIITRLIPTDKYIEHEQGKRHTVFRRRVIVVDGWQQLDKGAVS